MKRDIVKERKQIIIDNHNGMDGSISFRLSQEAKAGTNVAMNVGFSETEDVKILYIRCMFVLQKKRE